MAAARVRGVCRSADGMTLIELLIVIVIISILAAIAIPTYLNQRQKAKNAGAREGGRTLAIAVQTFILESPDVAHELPLTASHDELVAAGALDAGDWPTNSFSGGAMAITTALAATPGDYSYQALPADPGRFKIAVYFADGVPFVVP